VINRIIKTAKDRGPVGHDSIYGYGMVDPTGALTAEVAPVADNPLDTTPSPGIVGFGSAPSSGQAQSAPTNPTGGTVGARVPGANAGAAVPIAQADPVVDHRGWWLASVLFLLSVLVGLVTIRRFARLT
jgi:hypothetical protein